MDDNTIIKLLDKQETSIKNFIDISNARVEGRLDSIAKDVAYVKKHNERQNGWIADHTLKLEAQEDRIDSVENDTDRIMDVRRFAHKRWYVIVAAIALISLISSWSYHHINWIKSVEERFKIELIDE